MPPVKRQNDEDKKVSGEGQRFKGSHLVREPGRGVVRESRRGVVRLSSRDSVRSPAARTDRDYTAGSAVEVPRDGSDCLGTTDNTPWSAVFRPRQRGVPAAHA